MSLMVTLAMVTTLFFVVTNNAFTVAKGSSGALKSSTQAFAAGAIITMIANMLLIFVLGDDITGVPVSQGATTYVNNNPAAAVEMSQSKPPSSAMV